MKIWTLHEHLREKGMAIISQVALPVHELMEQFDGPVSEKAYTDGVINEICALGSNSDVIFAEDDAGKIVGMVTITFVPNFESPRAFLDNLAVAKKYRNNGVAGAMLTKAEEMSRRRGKKLLCAAINRDAAFQVRRLYDRAGFERNESDGYHKVL